MAKNYNVHYFLDSGDGATHEYHVVVEFACQENDYGNGYHMCVRGDNEPFGFTVYDIRYDTDFDKDNKIPYIVQLFAYRYTGEDGSWKLIGISVHEAE